MKKKSDIIITASIVIASAALLFGLYAAVENNPFRKSKARIAVDFEDATGVKPRSKVLFLGVPVGQVAEITYNRPTNRARAIIEIDDEFEVPSNVQAFVSGSLLGESHIALESEEGTEPSGSLAGDAKEAAKDGGMVVLAGISRSTLESIAPGADLVMAEASRAAGEFADVQGERVNATITAMGELFTDLSAFSSQVIAGDSGTLSEQVEGVIGTLEDLIATEDDNTLAGNLTGIVRDLRDSSAGLKSMLEPKAGQAATVFERLEGIAGELEGSLETFNKLYDTLEKADRTLDSYGDASQSIVEASNEVESLATNMQGFADKVSDRPSSIIFSRGRGGAEKEPGARRGLFNRNR